ncbi:MAG: NrfD/PsrC family molybdoenzyme membrane anchor subunit [Ectothiorhodospiraceae bacterium]|jgi:formate-dependent nitrite reductase membrane component NrfD|nr:NrfD/PsrC family molybdoenzyme membrane anchor subunit [Ectothiorhodospiraceae bacterium]
MGDYDVFHTVAWPSAYAWYFFAIGISSAMFLFSGLSWFKDTFKPLRMTGALISLALLVLSGILLIGDLSQPGRFWHVINPGYWNMTSPLVWGSILLMAFGVVSILHLQMIRTNNEATGRLLACIGIALAIGLPTYTGFDLSIHQHRPVWNSSLMAPLAVALSLISGGAVASFLARGNEALMGALRQIMLWSAVAVLVMLISVMVTTAYGDSASELTYYLFLTGTMGFAFVVLGVLAGTVAPLAILLAPFGRTQGGLMIAGALILVGGAALRYAIMVAPQIVHTYY